MAVPMTDRIHNVLAGYSDLPPKSQTMESELHLLCRDYEELVPETWHVVHDADLIPRVGKFLRLYKRPGARVIVDRKGSIVVRPSPLELHLRPGTSSRPVLLGWQCMLCV